MTRIPEQVRTDADAARDRLARNERLTWPQFCAMVYEQTSLPTWWHLDGRPELCTLREEPPTWEKRVGYIESVAKIVGTGSRWNRASGGRIARWATLLESDRYREAALVACGALARQEEPVRRSERAVVPVREERAGEMQQAVVGVDVDAWMEGRAA